MKLLPSLSFIVAGASAVSLGVLGVGGVRAGTNPMEPTDTSTPSELMTAAGPECDALIAALDAQQALVTAFLDGDGGALATVVDALSGLVNGARLEAPPEIAAAVDAWLAPADALIEILEGIDLSDLGAVQSVLGALPEGDPGSITAQEDVEQYAVDVCGWQSAELVQSAEPEPAAVAVTAVDPFADAPEPPDCDVLDAAAGADAAGIDVDLSDDDGRGDFNLPGLWTKSCSYDNGAMSVSTISYNDLADVTQFYLDNLDNFDAPNDTDGVDSGVLDIDLGDLPESSLVTEMGDTVSVAVFEADIPFSVSFTGPAIDPGAVVAAAEAMMAAPPALPADPATTVG